jgi:hypothetical protein
MCDGASQSAIAEWTPGLEIPTINAAFWYLEANVYFRRAICSAARYATEMRNIRTEQWLVTATDSAL